MTALLSILLQARTDRIGLGEPVPVRVEVRNLSPKAVWLIGVVDGAESGARHPRWLPIVEGPAHARSGAEAPDFTSPLRLADFRLLQPGESFDPSAPIAGAAYFPLSTFAALSQEVGHYQLTLELDTEAPDERSWLGTLPDRRPTAAAEAQLVRERLAQVPRVRLRSNTLTLVVER